MIVPQENQFDRAHARVNELDLLRFFAALAVVFHHYSLDGFAAESMTIMPYPLLASISKYGYLGVELFFMISGFVILMTASNGDLKKFVISRLIRLYPAFWVCCSITFFFTLAIGASDYSASINQYLINMTLLSDFMNVPPMDGVYWSLFVELKFYAFVAVIIHDSLVSRNDRIGIPSHSTVAFSDVEGLFNLFHRWSNFLFDLG